MRGKSAPNPKQNCPAKPDSIDDSVKLKPLMGIRPGVYLSVLYSFVLIVILFFLLVFPGLARGGVLLSVITEPDGAAVRINGVYMGTSGDSIFLPKGSCTVEVVLPGFEKASVVYNIPRRVFGSLFFPLRRQIEFTLAVSDPSGAFAMEAADFAAWSFAGEPTAAWQIPLSLSEGAYRASPSGDPELKEIVKAASRFATTRASLRDLVRAKILVDNRGLSPSVSGLAGSISDIMLFLTENPGSGRWLAELLPPESADLIKKSDWYKINYPEVTERGGNDRNAALPARMQLAGLTFINIDNFMISESPVTRLLFETFISQNPEWKDAQTDYYPDQVSVPIDLFEGDTITGVTWYAAEAFCRWLTERLPVSMSGMEIRLPTEAEWEEYANFTGIEYAVETSIKTPGWEWCADPFAPLTFIDATPKAVQAVGSPERAIRRLSISQTRASLPPDLSSPFVAFRPVIAQRAN